MSSTELMLNALGLSSSKEDQGESALQVAEMNSQLPAKELAFNPSLSMTPNQQPSMANLLEQCLNPQQKKAKLPNQ